MNLRKVLYVLLVPLFAATACAESSYEGPLQGEFDESGQFAADLAMVVDYQANSFNGVMRDFQFSRAGFDRPEGSIAITGTVSRGEGDELLLKGSGEGLLTQGELQYQLQVDLESFYVAEGRTSVQGSYFGGGDFTEDGEYRDWPGLKGRFEAKIVCPTPTNLGPCTLPSGGVQRGGL
jgi:hypothetical protein